MKLNNLNEVIKEGFWLYICVKTLTFAEGTLLVTFRVVRIFTVYPIKNISL